jgi:hypothetical protein
MTGSHIHTPRDGRGHRRVFLNGREIKRVVYADTKKGVVRIHDDPPRMHRWRKRIIERTLHGIVGVELM